MPIDRAFLVYDPKNHVIHPPIQIVSINNGVKSINSKCFQMSFGTPWMVLHKPTWFIWFTGTKLSTWPIVFSWSMTEKIHVIHHFELIYSTAGMKVWMENAFKWNPELWRYWKDLGDRFQFELVDDVIFWVTFQENPIERSPDSVPMSQTNCVDRFKSFKRVLNCIWKHFSSITWIFGSYSKKTRLIEHRIWLRWA